MKEIKKIALGVIAIVVLLVAVDWAVGTWSEMMYYKSKYGIFHRQIYCLRESKEDILILGSSRAAHHYVPQIFEDSLGMSCYNAGSDGECIYYNYVLLAASVRRGCQPKIVLYETIPLDLMVSTTNSFSLDDALDRYSPHYKEIPEIEELFNLKGWQNRVKLMSKTYRYNSKLVQTIKCNYIPSYEDNGYEALNGMLDSSRIVSLTREAGTIEKEKMTYIKKLVNLCIDNNIKLVFCYSPTYKGAGSDGIDYIKQFAKNKGIPFIDSSHDNAFQRIEYYSDQSHMNDTGARTFSLFMVKKIKELL